MILKLYSQFGYDEGIGISLLLNYVTLQEGESFEIRPNVPHAYISGDVIEGNRRFLQISNGSK